MKKDKNSLRATCVFLLVALIIFFAPSQAGAAAKSQKSQTWAQRHAAAETEYVSRGLSADELAAMPPPDPKAASSAAVLAEVPPAAGAPEEQPAPVNEEQPPAAVKAATDTPAQQEQPQPAPQPPAPSDASPPAVAGEAAPADPAPQPSAEATSAVTPEEAPAADAAPPSQDKEEALLQLLIDGTEMEDVVDAYRSGDKFYLPIGQLSGILDFAITVDPAAKEAKGWFIRQQNTIDLTASSAQVKGAKADVPAGSIFFQDGELYVDSALLEQWMPLNFTTDLHRMTLGIKTREHLPFQDRIAREKLHGQLAQQQAGKPEKPATVKEIRKPYEAFSWPTVDLTFSPSYDNGSNTKQANYTVYSVGDVGYLTSRFFAAGDLENDSLSQARLNFGRDDYTRRLLGPLRASSFRFGDIESASLSQVASPTEGMGFIVSSRQLDRPDNFDVTNFIGDSQPGWEVELYRNGTLIDFQTVGSDGRYAFRNVPVLFGNNQFRLALYGPQGQVQEINKTINAEASLLNKGEVSYNLSVDEKNRSLFGVNDHTGQPKGVAATGELEYGLTKNLTVAAGTSVLPLSDGDHTYATSGLRASIRNVLTSLDGAYDTSNQGYSLRASASTNLHDTLLSVQQKIAHDFFSEENSTLVNPVNNETVARLDRQFGDLSGSLSYTRRAYDAGRREELWLNQFSRPLFGGIIATNTLQYDKDNLGLDNFTGNFFMRGYWKKTLLGGQLDYDVKPDYDFRHLKLSALVPVSAKVSDNVEFNTDLHGTHAKSLANTATFDMTRYKVSLTARADDNNDYFIGLTLNTSIGRMPSTNKWFASSKTLAESGMVAVYPYLDRNYNQVRDPGEGPPPGSSLRIGSQVYKIDPKTGGAIASQLATNEPVQISINADDQSASPFWSAGVDAYAVVPRPGKVMDVDFPVFETSQIDGTVRAPDGVSPQGIIVELMNADGQALRTAHAAFDGYYLIEGVMPGGYKLHVSENSLKEKHLRQDAEPSLTITTSDFFVKDIPLVDADAPKPEGASEGDTPETPVAEAPADATVADAPEMPRVPAEEVTEDKGQDAAAPPQDAKAADAPAPLDAVDAFVRDAMPLAPPSETAAAAAQQQPAPAAPVAAAPEQPAAARIDWSPAPPPAPVAVPQPPPALPVIISSPPPDWSSSQGLPSNLQRR